MAIGKSSRDSRGGDAAAMDYASNPAVGKFVPPHRFLAGLLLLIVAAAVTFMLVAEHMGGINLPGCGAGSPCAAAARSVWGKVPATSWPISFVGFAYFMGLLAGWIGSRGGVSSSFRFLVRVGALVSVMYLLVLMIERHLCWYCIVTHIANLAFWLICERAVQPITPASQRAKRVVLVFAAVSVLLGVIERRQHRLERAKQEALHAESTSQIIEATSRMASLSSTPAESSSSQSLQTSATELQRPWRGGFTGRYRLGPEKAAIRIVIMSDYQCVDCNRLEADVRKVMQTRQDVSLSAKHFPMCADCNPSFANQNIHPNACYAAFAAEAAGILGGNEAFWKMHHWLFDKKGTFTNKHELEEGVRSCGLEMEKFIEVMQGDEVKSLVSSDIAEGNWLGLHYTPMVFINGVELKGVFAPEALSRAVEQVAASNPPAMASDQDQPPPAAEKFISDWRDQPLRVLPPDMNAWAAGAPNSKVQVQIWGDFQEPFTAQADKIIRDLVASRRDIHYVFRHYPVDQSCNPASPRTLHPNACRAAQAAETAGLLGGADGYWKMHDWLMSHQREFSEQSLREAIGQLGFNETEFLAKMESFDVTQGIISDATNGKAMGLTGIPMIYINGRFVPRWLRAGDDVLGRIVAEAATEPASKP